MRRLVIRGQKNAFVMWIHSKHITLHTGTHDFSASYPFLNDFTGYLTDVPDEYYYLMMYLLLHGLEDIKVPPSSSKLSPGRPLVSYSGGADSTALLYVTKGIPVHITRIYSPEYENRQIRAVESVEGYQINTDFELVRKLYNLPQGFNIGIGYASMYMPLLPLLNTGTVALGVVFDDGGFRWKGEFAFNDGILNTRTDRINTFMAEYGIFLSSPLAGYSEVLTTRLAHSSGIPFSSCHTVGDETACRRCYKCFRKEAIVNNPIPIDEPAVKAYIMKYLKRYPLKMASSTIYGIQYAGYKDPIFERYMDIDVSFCERVNKLFTEQLGGSLLPGFEWQTEKDLLAIQEFVKRINDPQLYEF